MCETIVQEWLQKIWQRRKGSFFQPKGLLIMDCMRSHLLDSVKMMCRKLSTRIEIIPGGLKKILQPLDLSVNKSFKAEIRKQWECWMRERIQTCTKSSKMREAYYEDVAEWVSNAWKLVKISTVISGFKEAEIIWPGKGNEKLDEECNDA